MTEEEYVAVAIAACASSDVSEQRKGLLVLRDANVPEHLHVAIALLGSPDLMVRALAAETCAAIALATGSRILPLLDDPDALVRSNAVEAIATMRFEAGSAAIRRLLDDDDATVRASAAEALGVLGDVAALPSLERALRDDDDAVRGFAALSIGILGVPESLSLLESVLRVEESPAVRAELYGAQYRLGRSDRLEPLLEVILAGDFRVATVALNTLLDLASRPTVARLRGNKEQIARILSTVVATDSLHAGLAQKILSRVEVLEGDGAGSHQS